MKPWLNTTEDHRAYRMRGHSLISCFNEAVAQHHGGPPSIAPPTSLGRRFNEAVAQHHGGLASLVAVTEHSYVASMKPWLNTTEDP